MGSCRFPSLCRLRKRREFCSFSRRDCSFCTGKIVVQWRPSNKDIVRFGVTASRKCGGAVVRNQFRRRLKELFRLSAVRKYSKLDIHVRAISKLPISFQELQEAFVRLEQVLENKIA